MFNNQLFSTSHSRDFYRGKSFQFKGEWQKGIHYTCDEYNVDFVSLNNAFLACKRSHLSKTTPEFLYDEDNNIIGLNSDYWELVIASRIGVDGKTCIPIYDDDETLTWKWTDEPVANPEIKEEIKQVVDEVIEDVRTEVSNKINRVEYAVVNDLPAFDMDGNLKDSGISSDDFVTEDDLTARLKEINDKINNIKPGTDNSQALTDIIKQLNSLSEQVNSNSDSIRDLQSKIGQSNSGTVDMDSLRSEIVKIVNELVSTSTSESMVSIKYDALKALRDSNQLIPGTKYRINDYSCVLNPALSAKSAGHVFDIIVEALSTNKLSENANAIHREGNSYFSKCKLENWQLKYCLDNDYDRFDWVSTSSGKGVIYYMKDEFENECGYDFKNVQFERKWRYDRDPETGSYFGNAQNEETATRRYFYTFTMFNEDNQYNKNIPQSSILDQTVALANIDDYQMSDTQQRGRCFANIIKPYRSDEQNQRRREKLRLNKNILFMVHRNLGGWSIRGSHDNYLAENCHDNIIGGNHNFLDSGCSENWIWSESNKLGKECFRNSISSFNNVLSDECNRNYISDDCYSNWFGYRCTDNELTGSSRRNRFEANCSNNYLRYASANSFGVGCSDNKLDAQINSDYCNHNTFGNSCEHIYLYKNCFYNTFGNNCYNIFFGYATTNVYEDMHATSYTKTPIESSYNKIGDNCYSLAIYGENKENKINYLNIRSGVHGPKTIDNLETYNEVGIYLNGYNVVVPEKYVALECEINVSKNESGDVVYTL